MSEVVAEAVVRVRTDTTGTSSSQLKHEGEAAGKSYAGGVTHSIKGIVGTIGGFFAAEKIGEFAKSSVEAASEDQAAQRRLALAIQNSTHAKGDDIKATEEWLTKQSLATGISKDDLMPVYQQLVSSTGSLTKAKKELNIAEDVSAGTGKNLSVVGAALMKANNGTTASLSRLGLKTKTTAVDTLGLAKAHLAIKTSQEAYTAAVKKYGPTSVQAQAASLKLRTAQAGLQTTQTKGKTTTLSLDDALKKMSQTYGGQAAAKAKGFDGTMQRLHATIHEGEVAVGDRLIPVLQRFADWVIKKGIPGTEKLYHSLHEQLAPAFAEVRKVLDFLEPIIVSVIGFIERNPQTVKTFAVVLGILAGIIWTVTGAMAALDAILAVNPFVLAAIAIAALAAGLQYAYTHSEKFRTIVQKLGVVVLWLWDHAVKPVVGFIMSHWKILAVVVATLIGGPIIGALVLLATHFGLVEKAIHILGAAATWLWNNAFQPSIKFIVDGVAVLIDVWGHMLSALGHLPGFGWAKTAGQDMEDAAGKAHDFANAINKIPSHKKVSLDLVTTTDAAGVVHSSGGRVPALADGGIVRARPGGTLIRAGEGGRDEAVIPLDGRGMGGQIVVHGDYVVRPNNFDDLQVKQRRQLHLAAFAGRPQQAGVRR